MSLSGIGQFNENLKKVMETETFQKADFVEKMELGHRLLNSKYGLGNFITNKVKKLKGNK